MAKMKKAKDPWQDLKDVDSDFMAGIEAADDETVRARIAQVALNDEALKAAKALDQDLAEKKAQAAFAGEPYKNGAKANRLRIQYARFILESRGKNGGDSGLEG